MILRFVYTIFIGVLFAALVGFGIAAFYETPKEPEMPSALKVTRPEERVSESVFVELKNKQEQYDLEFKDFQERMKVYNRNVALIAIVASIVTLVISLTFFKKILLIADGLLLGGVLTLFYSIIRGIASGDDKFRFIIVAIGFVIALILGYLKLVKTTKRS
ncbi:MAG: hypothetical protein NUV69_01985 [Candidatus Curtissbacteria bacterium]|nr:hypothetical protein [Candidatus Curtissbacteria bacterium]